MHVAATTDVPTKWESLDVATQFCCSWAYHATVNHSLFKGLPLEKGRIHLFAVDKIEKEKVKKIERKRLRERDINRHSDSQKDRL